MFRPPLEGATMQFQMFGNICGGIYIYMYIIFFFALSKTETNGTRIQLTKTFLGKIQQWQNVGGKIPKLEISQTKTQKKNKKNSILKKNNKNGSRLFCCPFSSIPLLLGLGLGLGGGN